MATPLGGSDGRVTISPQGIVGYSSDTNEGQVRIASRNNNRRQDISSSHLIVETQGNEDSQYLNDVHNEPLHQRNEDHEEQPLLLHIIPPRYVNGKAKDCPLLSPLVFSCSRFTFRHSTLCMCCGAFVAIFFFVIFIVCVALLALHLKPAEADPQNDRTFHIAPLSTIELDLDKHKINTILNQGVKITVTTPKQTRYKYQGILEFMVSTDHISYTYRVLKFPRIGVTSGTPLVRYWISKPTGDIKLNSSTDYVVWEWGNLEKRAEITCKNYANMSNSTTIDVQDIYRTRKHGEHQVTILFCGDNTHVEVSIDITEKLPKMKTTRQSLYINNYANSNNSNTEVQFGSTLYKKSKLYINTEGLHNFHHEYNSIEIRLEPKKNNKIWKEGAIAFGVPALFLFLIIIVFMTTFIVYKKRRRNVTYCTVACITDRE